ncbi:hypothetical protein Tco_1085795 [Tanacetum coccineum]
MTPLRIDALMDQRAMDLCDAQLQKVMFAMRLANSELRKSLQDNASLFMKIAREGRLSAGSRSVVNKLEPEVAQMLKKRNNNATLYDFDQEMDLQRVETVSQFLQTPSKFQGDNVKVADIEKPIEDSAG